MASKGSKGTKVYNAQAFDEIKGLSESTRDGLIGYIKRWASALSSRKVTVNALKESIRMAEAADLPIKSTQAQWFPVAAALLAAPAETLAGVPVAKVMTTAANLGYVHGAKAKAKADAFAKSEAKAKAGEAFTSGWAAFAKEASQAVLDKKAKAAQAKVEAQMAQDDAEDAKADRMLAAQAKRNGITKAKAAGSSADEIITAALEALRALSDLTIKNPQAAVDLHRLIGDTVKAQYATRTAA